MLLTTSFPAVGDLPAETLTHSYTRVGLPTRMTGASTYVRGISCLADGTTAVRRQGHVSAGTRLDTTFTHDTATRRLSNVSSIAVAGGDIATVIDDTYTWSPAGQLLRVRDRSSATTINTCHIYDGLDRLTHSWSTNQATCVDSDTAAVGPAPYNTRWSYDPVGQPNARS